MQVVLPDGATDAKVSLDLPFQLEQSTAFTYLDVLGRGAWLLCNSRKGCCATDRLLCGRG